MPHQRQGFDVREKEDHEQRAPDIGAYPFTPQSPQHQSQNFGFGRHSVVKEIHSW
jgi:hypothetical protein